MIGFRVPVDTGLFNALQLQPRALLAFTYRALTASFNAAGISWPSLLRDWKFGFVASRLTIDYEEPLQFFDADEIDVQSQIGVVAGDPTRWLLDLTVGASSRAPAARVRMVLVPIAIVEPDSLSAHPAPFSTALTARLSSSEMTLDRNLERVRDLAIRIGEQATGLGEHRRELTIDRTLCEVADQWYFPDIPRLLEPAREALAFADVAARPRLADALSKPLHRFDLELSRPYFWRQTGDLHTRAYELEGHLVMIHQLRSTSPIAERTGICIESW